MIAAGNAPTRSPIRYIPAIRASAYEYPRAVRTVTPFPKQAASRLRNVGSLSQLAVVLGVQPKTLSYWLYEAPDAARYQHFTLPKKNGGVRRIAAPQKRLKYIQGQLADILTEIYMELEKGRVGPHTDSPLPSPHVLAHGFKPHYSIITNAAIHRNRRFVFNTDLRDFFPTINFGRVRGFFMTDRNFRLHPTTATLIAQIACYRNELPQGAPCSPVISNLIAHMLDVQLSKMATVGRCSYTRYADDLTFSTNEREFPSAIARLVRGSSDKWVAGDGLLARVYSAGFSINGDKSRMQKANSRQDATGLIVNSKVNVRVEYYKRVRAMCHRLFTDGYCYEEAGEVRQLVSPDTLFGMMNFIYAVKRGWSRHSLDHLPPVNRPKAYWDREGEFCARQPAFSSLYRHLLNYRSFHGIAAPVIVGEGITDALYIRAAIRTIGHLFPRLYEGGQDGAVLVDFYKHTEMRKFYQIGDGASASKKFITEYLTRTEKFQHPVGHPVIVVVDNDKEGREVLKAAANKWNVKVDHTTPFAHLVSNLYVMPIPTTGNAEIVIEDLFDPALLTREIGARKFTKENNYNSATHYGKQEFVSQIVRPERVNIDWTGFDPLLRNIEAAIADYDSRLAAAKPAHAVAAE